MVDYQMHIMKLFFYLRFFYHALYVRGEEAANKAEADRKRKEKMKHVKQKEKQRRQRCKSYG